MKLLFLPPPHHLANILFHIMRKNAANKLGIEPFKIRTPDHEREEGDGKPPDGMLSPLPLPTNDIVGRS